MQMDDILNAAIQDAGLETNLCSLLDNQCDNSFSTSSPSSSSCFTNFSKDFNNNDQDFNLNDLDLSFLTDASNDLLASSNLDTSSNSVSPVPTQEIQNYDLMLSDDPFLAVLNNFDQNSSNSSNNLKNISEFKPNSGSHPEQKMPNRKIIKINSLKSSNQGLSSYQTVLKQNPSTPSQSNPIVRLVSISNQKKSDLSRSDLNSLINFRNPLKTFNSVNKAKVPLSVNPVKVINLSQLQQKHLHDRLISTNACKRIIKIQNNHGENRSSQCTNSPQNNSNQNIKITKVVSSKPINFQNQSTTNMVYLNKTKNKLIQFDSNLNEIQKKPLVQELKNKMVITKKFNSNNITIPKVIMTPKTITTSKNGEKLNMPSNSASYSANCSAKSHLNVLNSHLSRLASSNQAKNVPETLLGSQISQSNQINAPINNQSVNVKNMNQVPQSNEVIFLKNESIFEKERDEEIIMEEEEELGHAETYADYMPSKLKLGLKHPDPIVETSSLASVEPPDIWYELMMPSNVYQNGALSALQLEAVVYACQKHSEYLPNSHRCGFLIGDGAGVGKGRTIAGIIYENYLQGRKKGLWLSVSNDLKYDAQRDFSDIGANDIEIYALNKLKYSKISSDENSNIKKGVIFSTYSSLIGESQQKSENKKYSSRLEQLFQWLGGESFDGVIVFDECHKAKNLVPIGSAKPTKTGLAVLELQEKLPKARIVYASATGASEPKNMAYMVRLGLWGTGTPFTDFNDFIQSVEKRGVGAMEIIAIDMKLRGMYIARQLSFTGVTFKIQEIPLRDEYIKMYDNSVKLWVEMKEKFQEALDLIDLDGKMKKTVWGQFWSSHQRFFKYLCLACKVPSVVDLAKKALNNNKCVVIGLQSTGEARTLEHIDEGGEINDFVSTARGVLLNLVEKHFPSKQKKQISRSSKNSHNVNQIFKRLSSYTNSNKLSKNRTSSESSISSFGDSSFYDSDSFESFSSDFESIENCLTNQYDSGISSTNSKKSNYIDSDDSDSLFSITKSAPEQNLARKKIKKSRNKLSTSPSKRKKFNTNNFELEEYNDRMNDEDIQIIESVVQNENRKTKIDSESDEEFSLPVKRVKSSNERNSFDIDDPFGFCISKPEQPIRPKPTDPNQIDQYIHELKSDLINAIKLLGKRLPANTLDELIDLLDGPDRVAEMTGRKGRIVSQKDSNNQKESFVYETRNETDVPVELMNFVQKEKFMKGDKLVAIISEAASSGISLQANRRYANKLKRVHITIELPWSADRAIQQFGRTHRSNQVSSPEYVFLISQLAGEKRFASTVAKRLESLGALTHGDRRATESRDLSQFNIDNKYGRAALENVIRSICKMEKPLARFPNSYDGDFINEAREALHGVGMIVSNKKGSAYPEKDYNNINKFLNRLLGCPVNLQNAIFTFFSDVLTAVILQAKRSGKWDMGIMDLGSNNEIATRKETKYYVLKNKSDACRKVEMHTVLVERGISWEKALEIYRQDLQNSNSNEIGFYLMNQVKNNNKIAILAVQSQDSIKLNEQKMSMTFSIYRPNTGLQTSLETFESLKKKFKKVSPSEAKAHWIEHFRKSANECIHRFREGHCSNIRNCDIGLRTRKFYILAGSVLTVWSRVENLLCHLTGSSQFRLQIIRVRTSDNLKIVGCVIPANCIKKIDSFLSSIGSKSYVQSHLTPQVIASDDKKSTKYGAQNYKKSNMTIVGDFENNNFINQNSKNFNVSNEKNQFFNFDIT